MTSGPVWLMTRKRLAKQQREASEWFVRLRSADPEAGADMLSAFMRWAEQHPDNAAAFRSVAESWNALDQHAATAQMMVQRRDSLEQACRYQSRRDAHRRPRFAVLAASLFSVVATALALWIYLGPHRVVYSTGLGERRSVTLSDGSTLTLDARSRVSATYSPKGRLFSLEAGHARFQVARDSKRPFVVRAGSQSVQALGTEFDVELISDAVLVTLIDGRVAVRDVEAVAPAIEGVPAGIDAVPIEMVPGDQLVVSSSKPRTMRHGESLTYATAWSDGKLFFEDEPLALAVERINRYATEQIHVDPSAAGVTISGIFNADDSAAFLEAVTDYFPITQERTSRDELLLRLRVP